jgi:hypothetical protein
MARIYAGSNAERAADIKNAVTAERERCAKIADGWIATFGEKNPTHVTAQKWAVDAVKDIAEAIRSHG